VAAIALISIAKRYSRSVAFRSQLHLSLPAPAKQDLSQVPVAANFNKCAWFMHETATNDQTNTKQITSTNKDQTNKDLRLYDGEFLK
jgi:hypothetical protein